MTVKYIGGQPGADFLKCFPLRMVGPRVLYDRNYPYAGVSQFAKERRLCRVRFEDYEHGDFVPASRLTRGQ